MMTMEKPKLKPNDESSQGATNIGEAVYANLSPEEKAKVDKLADTFMGLLTGGTETGGEHTATEGEIQP
jgi:hypothetical protein